MPTLDEIERLLLSVDSDLRQRILRSLGSYTVALFAIFYVNGGERLKFIGTGTLAVARKQHGILTAAHVWERLKSVAKVGITMTDNIDHRFPIDVSTIVPTTLSSPAWDEKGPDVAFLRIPDVLVGQIEAYHVFEDLEKPPKKLGAEALECWMAVGAPGELGTLTETHASLAINGSLVMNPQYLSGDPDYYEFEVDTWGPGIPKSYGGFSGGGLWRVPVYLSPSTGDVDWALRLKGVMFWQFAQKGDRRVIRCHGPETITSLLNLLGK